MKNKLIHLKGDNEAINIFIKKGNTKEILKELENKLESSKAFFEGALVNKIVGESLSYKDMQIIEKLLLEKFSIKIKKEDILNDIENDEFLDEETKELDEQETSKETQKESMVDFSDLNENFSNFNSDLEGEKTLFLKSTIRSGQVIESDGNVVIIGDINPGGEVRAKGNIVVFGSIKGVVKSGIKGNKESYILAFKLQPTQIGIANLITRMPDGEVYQSKVPEIARISGENIVIEEFIKNR